MTQTIGEATGDAVLAEAVDFTFDELIEELVAVRSKIKHLDEARWMLERRVVEVMQSWGSERMRTPSGIVTIPKPVSYDTSILAGLREITDPADLAGIYYPEHEELRRVAEKWNMVRGRKLIKHSADHAVIIEDAKIYGRPKVKIEEEAS